MNQILHCGPSDLNHPKVKPLTMTFAQQLKWNPKFLEFVFAAQRQACFDHTCEAPNSGWTCYVPDEFDVAYPLWSTNADQTLLLLSGT